MNVNHTLKVEMSSNEPKSRSMVNFLHFVFTYDYMMSFQFHVNHGKLCLIINMDAMKSQLNHHMFQF